MRGSTVSRPEIGPFHHRRGPCSSTPEPTEAPWCVLLLPALAFLLAGAAYGQNQPQPHFEVASIKPGGDIFSTKPQLTPGRLRWTTQLSYLIGYAYGLDFSRISGTHLGVVYAVEATFKPSATDGQVRLMLHSLLADRFQMRFHRATAEVDGYAISIGRGGIRMKEASAAEDSAQETESYVAATLPATGLTEVRARRGSISQLAETLGRITGMPLWDLTGLQGKYDFTFRFSQDVGADIQTEAPSLATAVQESLALTLRKQKGPLETLVVDSIEQPSEN